MVCHAQTGNKLEGNLRNLEARFRLASLKKPDPIFHFVFAKRRLPSN